MNIEKKRMYPIRAEGESVGHIDLDKLAIPETVKVTVLGKQIIPYSFDIYGHPNFTLEQQKLYLFEEEEIKRSSGDQRFDLYAEVSYEERKFDVPRSSFDTVKGIQKSLSSLSDLNQMLENRSLYHEANKGKMLNEFVLFGYLLLGEYGQADFSVVKDEIKSIISEGDVEEFSVFKKNNTDGCTFTTKGFVIPKTNSTCSCCGRKFSVEDLRKNPCIEDDGKFYHNSCLENYEILCEINEFTCHLMDNAYNPADYQFELLPNRHYKKGQHSHIPWFLFHTIHGDIIMGRRGKVIVIEWQPNYVPFDLMGLFVDEGVTKLVDEERREIHAWGVEKASSYVEKVVKNIDPNYSNPI